MGAVVLVGTDVAAVALLGGAAAKALGGLAEGVGLSDLVSAEGGVSSGMSSFCRFFGIGLKCQKIGRLGGGGGRRNEDKNQHG
jgi:hypothetical protein